MKLLVSLVNLAYLEEVPVSDRAVKRGGIEEVDWIKSLGLNFNDLAFGGLFPI